MIIQYDGNKVDHVSCSVAILSVFFFFLHGWCLDRQSSSGERGTPT